MRFIHRLAMSLLLPFPILVSSPVLADGPLSNLLHNQHGSCPADQQDTVTIPGRQIRIVTAKPQIIVSDASPRTRGFMHANNAFMPITGGPYVASVVPMNFQGLMLGAGCSQTSAASSALRAIHEMENQGHEVATQLAAHKASTDYLNAVLKSVQARMPAPANAGGVASADPATLQQCLDRLEKRIGDVEKLLIYHDNALKDVLKNQSGK